MPRDKRVPDGFAKEPAPGLLRGAQFLEQEDQWAHRSAAMRCSTCMFFVEKKTLNTYVGTPKASSDPQPFNVRRILGRCRRRSPTMAGFPAVFAADWCGDHKLDENKA